MLRYVPAYVMPLLASVAAIAIFTRLLPPEEYGLYAVVISLTQVVQSLLFTWTALGIKRFYEPSRRNAKLGALARTMYIGVLAGAAIVGILVLGAEAASAAGLVSLDPELAKLLWVAAAVMVVRQLAISSKTFELAALSGFHYVVLECGDSLVSLAAGVALCSLLGMGAAGILIGSGIGGLAVIAADLPHLRERIKGGSYDPALQRQLITFGLPMAATYFFDYVTASSDRLLIAYFLGSGAVGIYAVSYSVVDRAIGAVFMGVTLSAYPMLIRSHEREGTAGALRQATKNIRILLTFGLPALGGFIIVSPHLAAILVGPAYGPEAARLMPLLAVGLFLFNLRTHYFVHSLHLANRPSLSLVAAIPGAVLNLAMNVLLLPHFGVIAAVWSTVAAYALQLAIGVAQSYRHFPMPFPLRDAAGAAAATLVMCGVLLILPVPKGMLGLLYLVAAGTGVYGVLALALDVGQLRHETLAIAARLRAGGAT